MAITVIQSAIATGNSTSDPITATLNGVVARRWLIGVGACYNPGTMGASAFSDDQTSPSNSWSLIAEQQTGADVFSLAMGAAKVVNGGTVIGQLAPASGRYPTYVLLEVDAPFNSRLNTPKVHEWTGSTLNFTFNAPAHAGTAYPSTDWRAVLKITWFSDDDPTGPLVSAGWTLHQKQTNFSALTQTVAVLSMAGSGTSGPTVNVATGLGGGVEAVAIGTILAAPPDVFFKWVRTGTGPSAVTTSTLTFDEWTPAEGDHLVAGMTGWSDNISGFPSQGIDTSAAMLSTNAGAAIDAWAEARAVLATDGRAAIGSINTPGIGIYHARVDSDPSTEPFSVTLDMDPSGGGGWYSTWWVACVSRGLRVTGTVNATSRAWYPTAGGQPAPTQVDAGSATASVTAWVGFFHTHTGGHEGDWTPVYPASWTMMAINRENSNFISGQSGFLFGTGAMAVSPVTLITEAGAAAPGYTRGVLVLLALPGATDIPSGTALPIIMQMLH